MSKLNIAGWILIATSAILFANTILFRDLDPSVRVKAEAPGGAGIREIGHENKKPLRWISGGLFLVGMICVLSEDFVKDHKKKKRKKEK